MDNKTILGSLFIIAVAIAIGYFVPLTLMLGNQELTNEEYSFQLNLFQGILFAGSLVCLILLGIRELMIKDKKYGNSFGLFNIGEMFPFFKRFTAVQLTLYASILFGLLFLISNRANLQSFTAYNFLPQQFSRVEALVFSSLLIPVSEEMMSLAVTGLLILTLVLLSIKYKIPKTDFMIYYIVVIPILMGIIAVIWHSTAYSSSTINLFVVLVFWILKTAFILLTGFVVIGIILHMFNNGFLDFARLSSSDGAFYTIVGILIFLVFITVVLYRKRLLGSTKKEVSILG